MASGVFQDSVNSIEQVFNAKEWYTFTYQYFHLRHASLVAVNHLQLLESNKLLIFSFTVVDIAV
jgi:hypothetical protein